MIPGTLGIPEYQLLSSVITWTRAEGSKDRIVSSQGHVIQGVRNAAGHVYYNGWSGEPHASKHLDCGYEADGLARCKSACERHFQSTIIGSAK